MIEKPYQPVNCSFHDRLLHFETTREPVVVRVTSLEGNALQLDGKIKDVFTKEGAEFVLFQDGQIFRLDDLVEVNGYFPNGGCRV